MSKGRMEAFSDGVIAIIITIMVLELQVPHGAEWQALLPLLPVFASYILSFVYVGIYWNNHHHLLQTIKQVDGRVLWANMHLLFWLSLIPFATAWMGENEFAPLPVGSMAASSFLPASLIIFSHAVSLPRTVLTRCWRKPWVATPKASSHWFYTLLPFSSPFSTRGFRLQSISS